MVSTQIPPIPSYKKWITLLDGRQVLLRPITWDDKNAILSFFDRLSPDTKYLRFHYAKSKIPPEELDRYCCIDYYNSFAIVAETDKNSNMEIVGVGRYVRLPCSDVAEIAFVVQDSEQGNGIGTQMLSELASLARERSVNAFVAELLNENIIMLDILRKFDPALKQIVDGNSLLVTISLL
jgi:RimJ/RimL family protein N-acetyltransferase